MSVHIFGASCKSLWNIISLYHFVHFDHCHLQKSAGLSFPAEHFIPKVQQEQQISGKEGQLRPEQQPEWGQPAPRIRVFRQWAEQEETIQWGRGKGSWQSYCPWLFTEANDIHEYVYRFETNLVLKKDVVIKQSSILDFWSLIYLWRSISIILISTEYLEFANKLSPFAEFALIYAFYFFGGK